MELFTLSAEIEKKGEVDRRSSFTIRYDLLFSSFSLRITVNTTEKVRNFAQTHNARVLTFSSVEEYVMSLLKVKGGVIFSFFS